MSGCEMFFNADKRFLPETYLNILFCELCAIVDKVIWFHPCPLLAFQIVEIVIFVLNSVLHP